MRAPPVRLAPPSTCVATSLPSVTRAGSARWWACARSWGVGCDAGGGDPQPVPGSWFDGHVDRGALGHGVDRVVDTLERQPDGDQIVDRHLAGGDHRESPLVVVRARAVRPDD